MQERRLRREWFAGGRYKLSANRATPAPSNHSRR